MGFTVQKPGICTTVQDRGRFGFMDSGFSPSGVMDKRAFTLANILVENDPDDCVLEFVLAGPTLRFTTNTVIALTGGDFSPTLNGKPIELYKAHAVQRGSILRLEAPKTGMYGYLAIAGGGVRVPEVMGSFSTNLKCGIGGWEGRALAGGDYLPFRRKNTEFMPNLGSHTFDASEEYPPPGETVTLRVIMGPQDELFTEEGISTFLNETFETTLNSDRMGYRLDGPSIETVAGSDIISDGITFGAIQIPADGRPIIMLADRQTTGGYAKIATVASIDLPKLVQARPQTNIRFKAISVYEAQDLLRQQAAFYRSLEKIVRRPCPGGISPRKTARRLTPILIKQSEFVETNRLWIKKKEQAWTSKQSKN